ncbi:hypothetical protein EYZ11_007695 [Aspergillus tanneri]|uniref:Uncharacterized protein n=1 Tax=Aspergillus tanneri TaxID=1220188 RepID=A0A4S3JCB7_9EURO|nr:uncharacterized protein ATNIH1004_004343 [Aspergillus tanneri]KAA8648458.1 hypothetical protein ATNIH1004_004343 [Aspergillus tanneri]THC92823.1 hypothetical protein EYZ11_007695 [Aspergillus tanneri]
MTDDEKRGTGTQGKTANTDRKSTHPSTNAMEAQTSSSLTSRIQNSASRLARDAFHASGSSADAAHLLADGSKSGASSSTAAALAAAQQYTEASVPSSSSSGRHQSHNTTRETFRSSSSSQQGGFTLPSFTEEEFQHSYGVDPFGGDQEIPNTASDKRKGKGKETSTTNLSPFNNTISTQRSFQPIPTPSDGDAVVSLLSDSTFDPTFPPAANEPADIIETELSQPQLTPAEIEMIESFRRSMPPSDTSNEQSHPHRFTSYSLIPDINTILNNAPSGTLTDATTLRDAVLTGLPGSADWVAVEERYHDEVWGYLRPTLEAAAKEMESNQNLDITKEGPAVRRLKMILKHMQT